MLVQPTIAEERIAKMLAMHVTFTMASASRVGDPTGWRREVDRYVEMHWKEYLAAARAMMEFR